MMTEIR